MRYVKNFSIEKVGYGLLYTTLQYTIANGIKLALDWTFSEFFAELKGISNPGTYFKEEELMKVIDEGIKLITEKPAKAENLHKSTYKLNDEYFEYAHSVEELDYSSMKGREIAVIFEKLRDLQVKAHAEGIVTTWFIDTHTQAFSNLLIEKAKKIVADANTNVDFADVFSLLTTPEKNSLQIEEEIDSLNVLKKISLDKKVKDEIIAISDYSQISANIPDGIKEVMLAHYKKWRWISFTYLGPAYNIDFYLQIWQGLLKEDIDIDREIKKFTERPLKVRKQRNELIRKLGLSREDERIFNIAADIVYLKGYRKDVMFYGFYVQDKILKEIAKRNYLSRDQMYLLTTEEIVGLCKGVEIPAKVFSERNKLTIVGNKNGEVFVRTGKDAEEYLADKELVSDDCLDDVSELKGTTACSGKAKGKVRIINSVDEIGKMEHGDIMVSHTTFPSLVPAMKKASAILTEDGGITCHAAIVSRELCIPCITGIKAATKVLNDGDLVEVNASEGVVKKVKDDDWFLLEEIPKSRPILLAGAFRRMTEWMLDFGFNLHMNLLYKDDSLYIYFKRGEWDYGSNYMLKKSLNEPDFLSEIDKMNKKAQVLNFSFNNKLLEMDLKAMDDNELVEVYEEWANVFEKALVMGWIDNLIEFDNEMLSTYLRKYLDKLSNGKGAEMLSKLTIPDKQTYGEKQEEALMKIVEKARKLGIGSDDIQNMLENHAKEFGWQFYMYEWPGWGKEEFELAVESRLKDKDQEHEKIDRDLIMKQLGADKKHIVLIDQAMEMVFNKDLRKNSIFYACYASENMFREIAKRLYISYAQAKMILPWEMAKIFKGLKIDFSERAKALLMKMHDGKCELGNSKEGIEFFEKVKSNMKVEETDEIKGSCAYPGILKGTVKIVNKSEEMNKVKEGDIIVAHQTNPDILPAMKKAAAFVTDLGGMTCHAAIVSREMKKPCIVGTKIASKVLKDGMMIEIDASKGIVKVISGNNQSCKNNDSSSCNYIRKFDEITKENVDIAGGKGASLGEMTNAGIPVPPGFVVLSTAFDRFIDENGIGSEIDKVLSDVDHTNTEQINNASEKIKEIILSKDISNGIANEIIKNFEQLDAPFVAVRSSATSEDSASDAWAGQLDTFLNTSKKNLLENVQKCWASLFTPRAIFYRFEKGLHSTPISVAVVVQKMVQSDVSGIAFSVHPVTNDKNKMVIEAGHGLGEAVVSGAITPDNYVVEKGDLEIEEFLIHEINVAKQEKALRKSPIGNEWVQVEDHLQEIQKLSGKQIIELAKMISRIEQHYDFPCDIEWAMQDGELFITQSRPITTLK